MSAPTVMSAPAADAIAGRIGASGVMDPSADPMELLMQHLGDDPRMRLVAQVLQARAQEQQAPASRGPTVDDLQRQIERLRRAYLALREQYLRVTASLGACARCWGEDPRCRECGGAGVAGFFEPDHELFLCYVLPAVRRIRAAVPARSAPRADDARHVETQAEG